MQPQPSPQLLTVVEAARIAGVSRAAIYKLAITPGLLPIVKIGTATRIRASALDAWIASNETRRGRANESLVKS
jgi:excisionase family DNA binding protein